MNYLDIFDSANVWIKYVHFLNRKYYKNDFLEIGAGIGSFTDKYKRNIKNIFLTEIDNNNLKKERSPLITTPTLDANSTNLSIQLIRAIDKIISKYAFKYNKIIIESEPNRKDLVMMVCCWEGSVTTTVSGCVYPLCCK